jgi:hypothetical protein
MLKCREFITVLGGTACSIRLPRARLMRIGHYSPVSIAAVLFTLAALLSVSVATAAGLHSFRTEVSALLIEPAQAEEAKPLAELEDGEFERFITRNPGTLLGGVALPIILLLTILARHRHYLCFSIMIGAIAGAACQTIPGIATLIASPILARLVQSAAAALIGLMFALLFDLMFFIARLSRRLVLGNSLSGPDPVREWFREAILVQRWAPPSERTQEVDDAVVRWHIALVTGAGALVATVLVQGHFVAGVHEHFSAAGFLTTSVILIAALYILEPVRERILRLADPGHHEQAARDSLVRTLIDSPKQGWLLSASIVLGTLLVQVLIIGLEEAIHKATPMELLELTFSGLGAMPIAYFLCAALQKRLELKRAMRGTSAFSALLFLPFFLMLDLFLAAFVGGMTANFAKALFGSSFASVTIMPLVALAAALIAFAILFWLSLGVALVGGFIFSGLTVWVMQVVWPRTRGTRALVYLALAIVIATLLEHLTIAPLEIWGPGKPSDAIQLITETLATATGWLVGVWLSGVAGVLETYQKVRPELFPNLKMSPPHGSAPFTEL